MTILLSVLAPVTITDAMLISSTVAETDYAAWSGATTYAIGDLRISTATHRIYQSLRATNLNNDPTLIANRTGGSPWWLDVGPTNRWAMFDGIVSTATSFTTTFTLVLHPGFFNSLYLGGLVADTLAITVKDAPGGTVIYSYSGTLEASAPSDYYEYFYDRFKPATDYLASGIDAYSAAEITLTLTKASGLGLIGILALGDLRELGKTLYGAKVKPKTYSYIKIDEYGNNTIIRRKAATDMTATAWLDLTEANTVLDVIKSVLDVPCVWIGTDLAAYSALRVFGLGSGEISYDHPQDCLLSINVQGLI